MLTAGLSAEMGILSMMLICDGLEVRVVVVVVIGKVVATAAAGELAYLNPQEAAGASPCFSSPATLEAAPRTHLFHM